MAFNGIRRVLEEMGLGTFIQNFEKERVDESMIESLSDIELARLGIQTIGDGYNFRKKIKDHGRIQPTAVNDIHNSSMSATTSNSTMVTAVRDNVSQIRERLFQPYSNRGRKRLGHGSQCTNRGGRTWTANFVCLAQTLNVYLQPKKNTS